MFFQHDGEEITNFIRRNGFGILVSNVEGRPWATHLPLMVSPDGKTLSGHVAMANLQWKHFSNGTEVLAIFQGPHTYISSSWYTHENVPTWNYLAAHVYGTVEVIEGERLYQSLKTLVDHYEQASAQPVSVEKMTPAYLQKQMNGLVGFEIQITKMEASWKLSQNRDEENYQRIIDQLERRGDEHSTLVAAEMRKASAKH